MLEVDINDNIDSLEVTEDDSEEGRGSVSEGNAQMPSDQETLDHSTTGKVPVLSSGHAKLKGSNSPWRPCHTQLCVKEDYFLNYLFIISCNTCQSRLVHGELVKQKKA